MYTQVEIRIFNESLLLHSALATLVQDHLKAPNHLFSTRFATFASIVSSVFSITRKTKQSGADQNPERRNTLLLFCRSSSFSAGSKSSLVYIISPTPRDLCGTSSEETPASCLSQEKKWTSCYATHATYAACQRYPPVVIQHKAIRVKLNVNALTDDLNLGRGVNFLR